MKKRWTAREDRALLAGLAQGKPTAEIGRRIGRTAKAVRARRTWLEAHPDHLRQHGRPWSDDDLETLREMYTRGDDLGSIASALDRTRKSVSVAASKLGIRKPRVRSQAPRTRWTPELDASVRQMIAEGASTVEIATALGMTTLAIARRMTHLQVRAQPTEVLRERDRQGKVWRALEVGIPLAVAARAVGYPSPEEARRAARAYGMRVCGRSTPHRYEGGDEAAPVWLDRLRAWGDQ